MLSSVSEHKKAGMCLIEKICVSNKLPSGVNYNGISHKFNAND